MEAQLSRRDLFKLLALVPTLKLDPRRHGREVARGGTDKPPNVLIILFDAFSALDASLYGYGRGTTPNLKRIADRATVYHAHYAGANFTAPGVATLLTGAYPWSHRAFNLYGTLANGFERRTVFERMASAGYSTIAYSHNFVASKLLDQARDDITLLKPTEELCLVDGTIADLLFPEDRYLASEVEQAALDRTWDWVSSLFLSLFYKRVHRELQRRVGGQYRSLFPRGVPATQGLYFVLEDAVDWILRDVLHWAEPYFAYIHLFPPHGPYLTRRDFGGMFDGGWTPTTKEPHFFEQGQSTEVLVAQRQRYDEFIAYVDVEFARLYDSLAQSGALDNTYLILTSDHGEVFERGIQGHITETLYEPLIRVPLIICKPGQEHREDVHAVTSAVDLMPTILHLAGQALPQWCEGQVLPSFGLESTPNRSVFSVEAKSNPKHAALQKSTVAMIKGNHKLIHYMGYQGHEDVYELYNLADDPEELNDRYSTDGAVSVELKEELRRKLEEANQLHSTERMQ